MMGEVGKQSLVDLQDFRELVSLRPLDVHQLKETILPPEITDAEG